MRDLTVFPSILASRCSASFKSHGGFAQSFDLMGELDTHSDECLLVCALTRRVGVCSWRSLSVWGKRSIGLRWLPVELSSESSDGRWRSDESLQLQSRSSLWKVNRGDGEKFVQIRILKRSNEKNSKLTAHGYSRQRETLRIMNRVSYRKENWECQGNITLMLETKNECTCIITTCQEHFINGMASKSLQFTFEM